MIVYLVNADKSKSFATNKFILMDMLQSLGEEEYALSLYLQLQLEMEQLTGNKECVVVLNEEYEKFVNLIKKRIN